MIQIRDAIADHVPTCCPEDTLADVIARMWESDRHCLPVVDARGEQVVGEISDSDVRAALKKTGLASGLVQVGEAIMHEGAD